MSNLLDKFKSRKFWAGIIGVLIGLYVIVFLGDVEEGCTVIVAAIMGYNFAEAYVDGKREGAQQTTIAASTNSKEVVENILTGGAE